MTKATLILSLSLFSMQIFAEEAVEKTKKIEASPSETVSQTTKPNYMMCKNNNIVRTIRIEKKGRSCKTTYTKEGVDSIVGKSGSMALCQDVFDKIKDNLEKASWKCKDITQARVSTSIEEP